MYDELKSDWDEKVAAELKSMGVEPHEATSQHRARAVCKAARNNPELRQELVDAANVER